MPALDEVLRTHGISEEELLRRSKRLERWEPADRQRALARARIRRAGNGASDAEAGAEKPRSGRGVGRKQLRAAVAGRSIARVPRAKLLRALADALRHRGAPAISATELSKEILPPASAVAAEVRS